MLKLGTPVRYQGHWGRVIARTFGRERLYDITAVCDLKRESG
jgi:hypothetical protein